MVGSNKTTLVSHEHFHKLYIYIYSNVLPIHKHMHLLAALFFYEGQFGFQLLARGHFGIQLGRTGH